MFYSNRQPSSMAALSRGPPSRPRQDADDDEFDIPLRLRPINSNMDRLLYGAPRPVGGPGANRPSPAPWSSSNYSFGQSFNQLQSFAPPPAPAQAAPPASAPVADAGIRQRQATAPGISAPGGGATPRAEEEAGWNVAALAAGGAADHDDDEDDDDKGPDDEPDIPLKLRAGPSSFDQLISTAGKDKAKVGDSKKEEEIKGKEDETNVEAGAVGADVATAPLIPPPPAFDVSQFAPPPNRGYVPPPQPSEINPISSSSFAPPSQAAAAPAPAPNPITDDDYDSDADDRPRCKAKGRTPNRRLTIAELESLPDQELLMQALQALGYRSHRRDDDDDEDEDEDEEEAIGDGFDDGTGDGEFGSARFAGSSAGGSSAGRRKGRKVKPQTPVDTEIRLKKGRGNFGMQWGQA